MAMILDPDSLDLAKGPRTYALRIEVQAPNGDCIAKFHKFGFCSGSVRRRFSSESSSLRITILMIWLHETLEDAKKHEGQLFRKHRPTCLFASGSPFDRTEGILLKRGNTELFLADRFAGEPDVAVDHALFLENYEPSGYLRFARPYLQPDLTIYSGSDEPAWLQWLSYVPQTHMFLPRESSLKQRLIFVRASQLLDDRFEDSKGRHRKFVEQAVWCDSFGEAVHMCY